MNLYRAMSLGLFLFLLLPLTISVAQDREKQDDDQNQKFVPFEEFLQRVKAAKFEEYRRSPASKVESAEAFEDMRAHILRRYHDVKAEGSFVLAVQYAA